MRMVWPLPLPSVETKVTGEMDVHRFNKLAVVSLQRSPTARESSCQKAPADITPVAGAVVPIKRRGQLLVGTAYLKLVATGADYRGAWDVPNVAVLLKVV